jgi:hypothetical protein
MKKRHFSGILMVARVPIEGAVPATRQLEQLVAHSK